MLRLIAASAGLVLALTSVGLAAAPASAADGMPNEPAGTEEALFTVQSAHGSSKQLEASPTADERFRLTLTGVDPVTKFANRPFRDAVLISPKALDANWDAWFAGDPPNAVLTYLRPGRAPGSMVIELTNPTYSAAARSLSFTAIRIAREHDPVEKGANWQRLTTPATMDSVSLFIDLSQWEKKEP